jgi:hypothetical protein
MADVDVDTRLQLVRETMADQAQRARTWNWTWGATGLAISASSFTIAALRDTPDDRVDPITAGVASLVIPATILLRPFAVIRNQAALDSLVARGDPDRCVTLARAEELFAESAEDEAFRSGVIPHALVIGANTGLALFLGLGFGHWRGALLAGGGGLLLGEIRILTQPTGAVGALKRYRDGEIAPTPRARDITLRVAPMVEPGNAALGVPGVRGVALGGTF